MIQATYCPSYNIYTKIASLRLTIINFSIWMNVHICSTKSLESFDVFQIDKANIRQPYFVQEMFSDF